MTTPEHGTAAEGVGYEIKKQVDAMGLKEVIKAFEGSGVRGDTRGKNADHGWGPKRPPPGSGKLSVALEVAVSETQENLKRDVDFWLDPEQGKANIALAMKISRTTPMISFQKWERVRGRSHQTQNIKISKGPGGNINISGAPMIIEFHHLFRRPISCPREVDVQLRIPELSTIANAIWDEQGF